MAMEMDHFFTVPVSPDQAWDVLLDVERIAPCMPGATVEEFDGEVVTGRIKVKVGPVSLTYRGTAKFTERNSDTKNIVLEASGKETRGSGTASATVRAWLESESSGEATKVSMHTTMNVTGRPAQFGRGVIVEVGGKLVEQFAQNLRQLISSDGAASADAPTEAAAGSAEAGTAEAGAAAAGAPGTVAAEAAAGPAGAGTAEAPGTDGGEAAGPAGTAAAGTITAPTATAVDGAEAGASAGQPSVTTDDQTRTTTPPVTAPVASTAPAPPAAAAADSINLVRLVGPSILKRVVPVAAGLAVLALLGRRFRHVFRRGSKK
jgi:carbon monoxide dehydrogenase subunit G